jgi:hypothetical protein
MNKQIKKDLRVLRKRAIKLQNSMYPKKVSMAEALRLVQKGTENA